MTVASLYHHLCEYLHHRHSQPASMGQSIHDYFYYSLGTVAGTATLNSEYQHMGEWAEGQDTGQTLWAAGATISHFDIMTCRIDCVGASIYTKIKSRHAMPRFQPKWYPSHQGMPSIISSSRIVSKETNRNPPKSMPIYNGLGDVLMPLHRHRRIRSRLNRSQ